MSGHLSGAPSDTNSWLRLDLHSSIIITTRCRSLYTSCSWRKPDRRRIMLFFLLAYHSLLIMPSVCRLPAEK